MVPGRAPQHPICAQPRKIITLYLCSDPFETKAGEPEWSAYFSLYSWPAVKSELRKFFGMQPSTLRYGLLENSLGVHLGYLLFFAQKVEVTK